MRHHKIAHPESIIPLHYIPRSQGGRGLLSVLDEYKACKIKLARHLETINVDKTIKLALSVESNKVSATLALTI